MHRHLCMDSGVEENSTSPHSKQLSLPKGAEQLSPKDSVCSAQLDNHRCHGTAAGTRAVPTAPGLTTGMSCNCCCERAPGQGEGRGSHMRNSSPSASLPAGAVLEGHCLVGLWCRGQCSPGPGPAGWDWALPAPCAAPAPGSRPMEVLGAMPTWGYINVKAFYISLFYLQIIYI